MNRILLVSCVAKKREGNHPARDLYISQWFLKARAYAEQEVAAGRAREWLILSAMYGVVKPDSVIPSYERTLNTEPAVLRQCWAAQVGAHLRATAEGWPEVEFVFLAGKHYRSVIPLLYPATCTAPLEHLGIGQQMKWFNERKAMVPYRIEDTQAFLAAREVARRPVIEALRAQGAGGILVRDFLSKQLPDGRVVALESVFPGDKPRREGDVVGLLQETWRVVDEAKNEYRFNIQPAGIWVIVAATRGLETRALTVYSYTLAQQGTM